MTFQMGVLLLLFLLESKLYGKEIVFFSFVNHTFSRGESLWGFFSCSLRSSLWLRLLLVVDEIDLLLLAK